MVKEDIFLLPSLENKKTMTNQNAQDHLESDSFYICITGKDITSLAFSFYSIAMLKDGILKSKKVISTKLFYFRRFNNMMDALGQKLLFESLSAESITSIIHAFNPGEIDMTEALLDDSTQN